MSQGKFGKVRKSWNSDKSNQNIVMNEKFVKNIALHEKFVKKTA